MGITIKKIVILGAGNVAWHLAFQISRIGIFTIQLYCRNKSSIKDFEDFGITEFVHDIKDIDTSASLYIICVNDDNILTLAKSLDFNMSSSQILVHTSGAQEAEILKIVSVNYGCIWPVQTLSKGIPLTNDILPFIVTSSDKMTKVSLFNFLNYISHSVHYMDDSQKSNMHMGAVVVNNFSYHLWILIKDFCKNENIDFNILSPLIEETMHKTLIDTNQTGQTGPARRHDNKTIEKHKVALINHSELYDLYTVFTESIKKRYNENHR